MTNTQLPHAAKLHHCTNKLKVVLRLDPPTHLVAQRALQPVSHCQRLHGALLLLPGVCVARAAGERARGQSHVCVLVELRGRGGLITQLRPLL